jgi:hypothetical protein
METLKELLERLNGKQNKMDWLRSDLSHIAGDVQDLEEWNTDNDVKALEKLVYDVVDSIEALTLHLDKLNKK